MDTWLVTGGAGFIGGCFVRHHVAVGKMRIVNLDKLTYAGNLDSLQIPNSDHYHFALGDIGDPKIVGDLLATFQPLAIINFAAESHVDRSIDGPLAFAETNVMGTCRLLEAARSHYGSLPIRVRDEFRFLHVSTDEVYGSLGSSGLFSETTPYSPNRHSRWAPIP